jgi:hypothetical protein
VSDGRFSDLPIFAPVVAPPEAEEGRHLAAAVLEQLEERHPDALTSCRWAMRRLWLERFRDNPEAFVTADDVRDFLAGVADPSGGHSNNNWRGAVWSSEEWAFTGQWVQSRHPGNHAHVMRCWRLAEGCRTP